jgi:hypothetical protein
MQEGPAASVACLPCSLIELIERTPLKVGHQLTHIDLLAFGSEAMTGSGIFCTENRKNSSHVQENNRTSSTSLFTGPQTPARAIIPRLGLSHNALTYHIKRLPLSSK